MGKSAGDRETQGKLMYPTLAFDTEVVHRLDDGNGLEFPGSWGDLRGNSVVPFPLRQLGISNRLFQARELSVPKFDQFPWWGITGKTDSFLM